jgi:hypothetical protein
MTAFINIFICVAACIDLIMIVSSITSGESSKFLLWTGLFLFKLPFLIKLLG